MHDAAGAVLGSAGAVRHWRGVPMEDGCLSSEAWFAIGLFLLVVASIIHALRAFGVPWPW